MKWTGTLTCTLAVFAHAQEVCVQRTIGHGVEFHVLGKRADSLAADLDHDDRVEEVAGAEQLVQQLFLDMNQGRFFVISIDDGGYAALTAESAGGSLASPIACLGRQRKHIAHCMSPSVRLQFIPATPPGMTMTGRRAIIGSQKCTGKQGY
jgi:hypothetical protein